ncbi:MAG: hypothetical protein RIC52_06745 [Amphiplicatus sp.]
MSKPDPTMPHPLEDYLAASGDSPAAFARRIGASAPALARIIHGDRAPDLDLARRIVDATDGAVALSDLCGGDVADFVAFLPTEKPIETALLAPVLKAALERLSGQEIPDALAMSAAEAAADTHAALARVTTRRGPDRLAQALRPVLEEILQESGACLPAQAGRLEEAAQAASALYFRALAPRPR